MTDNRVYFAIDLKSFFASVECVERGLDPLTTKLVVADESRTEKTICLAISPAMKKLGLGGRARLFEVIAKCKDYKSKTGLDVEYIIAPPRMQKYIDYSTKVYETYLKYISPEDIHVYSIDEVFIEATKYMNLYKNPDGTPMSPHDLVKTMIKEVLKETGITATAGIGTNMYLAKIAMDIVAKKAEADEDGVRIASLDERSYRELLWEHTPITDFWRVGRGTARRLAENGIYTMGDIARISMSKIGYGTGEDLLFKLFGIDAEILIDHAWGVDPCIMADIKNYKTSSNSISTGQVLSHAYDFEKCRIIVKEMVELHALDLVAKNVATNSITLDIGYDREFDEDKYNGDMSLDPYGRLVPKPVHGSFRFKKHTSSTEQLREAVLSIYDKIVDRSLCVRRLSIAFNNLKVVLVNDNDDFTQLSLFTDYDKIEKDEKEKQKERKMQEAVLKIQGKYGKNAILKGTNLEEGATSIERNMQIGGHKA